MDGSFCNEKNLGAVVAILRDNLGKMIIGRAHKIHVSSSLMAEAIAIREGLILASNYLSESLLWSQIV